MKRQTAIDWAAVRARLEENRIAAETASAPGPGRIHAAYRERAARLAQPAADASSVPDKEPVLVFRLGAARYGIPLVEVLEILPHPRCAAVPGAPPELAGVLQVRGEIRPVWELSRLLDLPDLKPADPEYVLLLRSGRSERGLRVNQVEGIQALRPEENARPRDRSPHVKWITPDLIAVLDTRRLWKEES